MTETVALTKHPVASPDYTDGNTGEDVYHVSGFYGTTEVRVPAGTPVIKQDSRWGSSGRSTDPRGVLPNMEIRDGALVLPISDFVTEIVARAEPVDLAKSLWAESEEVREEFIYCMANRYNEGGIGDGERRKLLQKVKEAIHSKALDRLADAMHKQEYEARNRAHQYDVMAGVNQLWRDMMDRLSRISPDAHTAIAAEFPLSLFGRDPEFKEYEIGGKHWNESRDFWRERAANSFPAPAPIATPDDEEIL